MKQYGANKATEFTRKQIGVIYSKAKAGELKVEKWVMQELYNLADYYGYDDSKSVEKMEKEILNILESVFAEELAEAQEKINNYTEKNFSLLGNKAKEKADRNLV